MMETFMKSMVEKDMDRWIELFDDNVVFEFPYAPDGYTRKLEGKSALYQYVKELPGIIEIDLFTAPAIHQTLDPNVFIAEFGVKAGRAVKTGKPYLQTYISVIETKDGKIMHYKDYWNPLTVLTALDEESGQ
ncbi:nuclear transport factor 2 family protein [Paenibacillus ehimensis]|uniref:Nuclear transport factor 2 family protein n=2 Tax=Paenibacillus ehimensis TaxID=79264 RepID=A0ABT8V6T3_9BACL|nr:nuclear transport factor 2 family protein [Paenibacillus ehimensis]MDO3676204.1 nuclear transport factor 2 family protein [Paenibacillus ehimensis]MEC0210114.1 nuclear transport factor 2 family protein [Paenibacillus ehimensis]